MGTRFFYYIIILPISILPYPFLYLLSDILYLLIYKIIGYRKNVVITNLNNAFPEKDDKEINDIMSKFYRHLCDIICESLKAFTISEKQLKKRLIIRNHEIADEYAEKGQGIIFVGGHINNWEICAQASPFYSKHQCVGIYKPLSNDFINKKMTQSRERYGLKMTVMKLTKSLFEDKSQLQAIIFGSDQSPSNPERAYWMNFLNQDTGVLFGVEKYAKEYNWPVIYVSIHKIKRGYYEVFYQLITDKPNDFSYGEITENFTKLIEKDIIKEPQYWLWGHRRWKHKKPEIN